MTDIQNSPTNVFKQDEDLDIPEIRWRETLRMFCTNKAAVAGVILLLAIVLVGLLGPFLFPADPFEMVAAPLSPPGEIRLLGTDYLGRDILTALVYGARPTLAIAASATLITVFLGVSIGALAGFYGGKIDSFLMGITEFFQVLPNLIFSMVVVAVFTPTLVTVIFAIGATTWTSMARLTRAEFLKIREREFVMAARAVGARNGVIIRRVILPNALPPLTIAMTLQIGICILFEAALSFLGLNDPDVMTWGMMIGLSRDFFFEAWWTVTFPGLAILITVLSIALIGDGLNDAFNPKFRGR